MAAGMGREGPEVASHRRSWPSRLATAAALLVLLSPVGLAVAAPRLAPLPAPVPAWTLPPLPEPAPDARPTLDGLVDPLPIVVRDLPDPASRLAVADYDAASLLEPRDAADMFLHAWEGLAGSVSAEAADAVWGVAGWLSLETPEGFSPDLGSPEFAAALDATMMALAVDPRNADRLNNAAVALFALGVGNATGPVLTELDGFPLVESFDHLQNAAILLLAEADRAFPPSRAVLLNLGFFTSLRRSPVDDGARPDTPRDPSAIFAQAILPVARRLAIDPGDGTARLLLGSLQVRQTKDADGLGRALATLTPLTAVPETAPLGHAAVGDAYLQTAAFREEAAPFHASELARLALAAYDRALVASTDPGLYAGRAAALAGLGEAALANAVAAQRRAVALAPRSVPLRLGLATLEEAAGEIEAMRATAREALALTLDGWDLPVSRARFLTVDAEEVATSGRDRGFLGFSFGSDRDHATVAWDIGGRAGGYIVTLDLIPTIVDPDTLARRRTGFAADEAVAATLTAAVALGDEEGAAADAARWAAGLDAEPRLAGGRYRVNALEWLPAEHTLAEAAARLVAGRDLPASADATLALRAAETALRRVGRFGEAAALCRRASAAPAAAGFHPVVALRCAGETSYLGGDFPAAATALGHALDLADDPATPDIPTEFGGTMPTEGLVAGELRPRAAAAAQAAGDEVAARRLFTRAAAEPGTALLAFAKLGELDLAVGDNAGALRFFDLALAAAEVAREDPAAVVAGGGDPDDTTKVAEQRARSNHGIALLRLAQDDPEVPPDCGGANRDRCVAAWADATAALAADPFNPVYLLNAGWAARLLGDRNAARDLLARAAAADPSLFPALNDLGVLAAEEGDGNAAREAFRAALAAAPDYDLAAWNLGVLELRRGLPGLLPGQGWLMRALSRSPSFRGHDLAFKTDERVYRVAFGPGARPGHGWSFGRAYSFAAVALGSVTLLAAVGRTVDAVLMGKLSDAIGDLGREPLARAGAWLSGAARRRRRGSGRWWVAWEPWLVTIPVLVMVTAWPAWRSDPGSGAAAATLALAAAAVAVVAHEAGHALAARWARARLVPAQWGPGVALALLLLPLRLSSGPYVGQRVIGATAGRAWWVYLAGPAANLAVAVAAYGLFLGQPAPLLRLLAEVQLAAIGYALLPFEPLDGPALGRARPGVVAGLGLAVAVAGVLFALGLL